MLRQFMALEAMVIVRLLKFFIIIIILVIVKITFEIELEQHEMEAAGCEIIGGVPTTLHLEGQIDREKQ